MQKNIFLIKNMSMSFSIARFIIIVFSLLSLLICGKYVNAAEVRSITTNDFTEMVQQDTDFKMIFFFTSWCGSCRKSFKDAASIFKSYQDNKRMKIILISLDTKLEHIEGFASDYDDTDAVIYYINSSQRNLAHALYNSGINYKGSIPHITIFHKREIIADDTYDIKAVKKFLENLLLKTAQK